jgi:hypothetical protein
MNIFLARPQPALALLLALVMGACRPDPSTTAGPAARPTDPVLAAPAATPATPAATAEPPDSGWQPVAAGVELRRLRVPVRAGVPEAQITVARLDPAQVRFRVGYSPGQPLALSEWLGGAPPLALITGGFFSESFESTALVISGGVAAGESYVGRGGMFAVDRAGAITIRSLADQPYDPAEPLDEAVQGWPILIKPGGEPAYTAGDPELARRSVVALDRDGRVLLFACSTSSLTLADTAAWLAASDMGIDAALNLDGGKSTALFVEGAANVEPFVRLPLVLIAERR